MLNFLVILEWFVDDDVTLTSKAMNEHKLIEEEDVEVRPEKVPTKCLSEEVALTQVRKYFTVDGWKAVCCVRDAKKEHGVWLCDGCHGDLSRETSLACDGCLSWYHCSDRDL